VHGHGTGDLLDAVCAHLDFSEPELEEDRIPVAIIGRPNVGKSSLTNRILGENRMIVANEAGTTRDAIDTPVDNAYGKFIFTDTAGLRKRSNITDGLERYMVVRALAAVERSRVALILVDATVGFTEQDSKVAGYAHEQGKACIIVVNKWDAVEGKETNTMELQRRGYAECFSFMNYAPIIFISAQTGYNVNKLMQLIREVDAQNGARVPTGVLNEMLAQRQGQAPEDLLSHPGFHPPAHVCGVRELQAAVPFQLSALSHQSDPRELWADPHAHPHRCARTRRRRSARKRRVIRVNRARRINCNERGLSSSCYGQFWLPPQRPWRRIFWAALTPVSSSAAWSTTTTCATTAAAPPV
jgi:small GTP-binding protein